jgi:hypothetical protein
MILKLPSSAPTSGKLLFLLLPSMSSITEMGEVTGIPPLSHRVCKGIVVPGSYPGFKIGNGLVGIGAIKIDQVAGSGCSCIHTIVVGVCGIACQGSAGPLKGNRFSGDTMPRGIYHNVIPQVEIDGSV